ncbi:CDP-alcohol phosphatidyltransferase family protein [Sphaerospermopsis aphanizomenoides BCCUSP55]|uniref:CDP-alcohol phosphatidyltransferase family protein n=1 Tax=Sphaerospermopsis aphanizomenoides TaxID=459663 RepID=UPI001903A70B|nr:CDP-alcohol phosphatidyltransferase family protein [Sphaerospermopsis aphanizomenoides]MBK1986493.1 CDP-alcohol phosphatidyltransferase family protein [Sphaerospermopsis aphanizomenoides BCCUSP55]
MNAKYIPTLLVIYRFVVAPFLLWDALDGKTTIWFLIGFITAFIGDIFDGIIARRLGVSTAELRQADSWADVCLFSCVFISAWLVHPQVLIAYRLPLLTVVFVQVIWWIVNFVKYGKPASYHTYSAKFWGMTLFIAIVSLFGFNYAGIALWLTCIAGFIHTIEEIAMTLVLPVWTHDVLSIFHALKIRPNLQQDL